MRDEDINRLLGKLAGRWQHDIDESVFEGNVNTNRFEDAAFIGVRIPLSELRDINKEEYYEDVEKVDEDNEPPFLFDIDGKGDAP